MKKNARNLGINSLGLITLLVVLCLLPIQVAADSESPADHLTSGDNRTANNGSFPLPPAEVRMYEKGVNCIDRFDFAGAEDVFRELSTANPRNASVYIKLGQVLSIRGNDTEAVQAFLTALSYEPQNAEAFSRLGWSYQQLGEREKATEAFANATKFNTTGNRDTD